MPNSDHFALLTITKRHFHNAFIVHVTTNNPCHLSLYFTTQTPLTHKVTRILRGLGIPWGAYFCFVGWQIVPQWQAGDTLDHTFLVYGLAFSEKVWYTFRGTVAALLSPSSGPIIEHVQPHQDIILNSTFEDWPVAPDPPDHWFAMYPPGHAPNYLKSSETPLPYFASCRQRVPILSSFQSLRQNIDPTFLSDLPITLQPHYLGCGHWYDYAGVYAYGDDTRIQLARPTLPDQWHTLTAHITLPSNLTSLQIRLNNTDHMLPVPKDVWWWHPDIYYGYV